jgi:hypothetical protein
MNYNSKIKSNNLLGIKRLVIISHLKDFVFISIGVVMASIGLKGFLLPNNFLDGGAMGVALLLEIITKIDLSFLIILVNFPFIVLGARQISFEFAFKSALAILLLSILVHFISLPTITNDKLLIAIFGGFFLGSGIGLSIRGGAVIDGTEVVAISISRKTSLTVGDFIAVLLYPNQARQLHLEDLGYRVFVDEHYDKNRLLFSDEKLLEWFLDDSKVYLDFQFSLKSVYLMK